MTPPPYDSFARYLSAKRTVDDRALNRHVWHAFRRALTDLPRATCLELGGGIGTMVERLWDAGWLPPTTYHLVDAESTNIAAAAARLGRLAPLAASAPTLALRHPQHALLDVHLHAADVFDYLDTYPDLTAVDCVIANAFLDLVDLAPTLDRLATCLRPGAFLYLTINFDGATILEPTIDRDFDALVERAYHQTMDARVIDGRASGDSHTGRHLYHALQKAGNQVLAAGSSDWVVIPHGGAYPHDEAYFLHFIVNTMYHALAAHPLLDRERFTAWIDTRHRQIETGELVYIAHQLDYFARVGVQATSRQ